MTLAEFLEDETTMAKIDNFNVNVRDSFESGEKDWHEIAKSLAIFLSIY